MNRRLAAHLVPIALAAVPRIARAETPSSPEPAAASTPAPAPEDAAGAGPAADAAVWRVRDAALFEQDGLAGGVGLLHTQHAESGASGQVRFGFVTEAFSAGFLCTSSSPCANARGPGTLTRDSLTHVGGSLTLSATVTDWLEAYGVTSATGNSDSANKPALLQVLGDTQLGLKAFHGVSRVLHLGGVAELDLVNASGAVGVAGGSTGGRLRFLGTLDLRDAERPIPLRVSLNAAYVLDNSAQVVSSYEAATGGPVTRIERFGLEINRVDHIDMGVGAETFLATSHVRPFLEYSLLIPINRQGYACPPINASQDGCLANDLVVPSKLTLGSRFYPWKRGFSLVAAVDIGVTGVKSFIEEVMPTPPWMFYLGAGWAVDTWDRPPVERTRTVERVIGPKPIGSLRGLVHRKVDPQAEPGPVQTDAIDGAIVVFDDHPDVTSRATGTDGRFVAPLEAGSYKLVVHAKGYRDGICAAEMPPSPADASVDCPLEPAMVAVTATEITIQQQIQFQVDSAIILPESDGLMREIADTLIKNPRITKVEVQGHTDSSGSNEYNMQLSQQRASAVREWLTTHGVPPDRLVARGYGEERPLIPNVTKGMKALNRRVQFIILEQTAAK